MFIVLLLLTMTPLSYSMQLNDCTIPSCNATERGFLTAYLKNTLNIETPQKFTVEKICSIYNSENLKTNSENITSIIIKNSSNDAYSLKNLKKNEYELFYTSLFRSFRLFFKKVTKAIECHCKLPLSAVMQKQILRRFWFAHWSLILPTKVKQLYNQGMPVSNIDTSQKELLTKFRSQCTFYKQLYILNNSTIANNMYISEESISCYTLCMLISGKFSLLAEEIKNQQHVQIKTSEKFQLSCAKAAETFLKLPYKMESLNPHVIESKNNQARKTKKSVKNTINLFWQNFWRCTSGKLKDKIKLLDTLSSDIDLIITQHNSSITDHDIF